MHSSIKYWLISSKFGRRGDSTSANTIQSPKAGSQHGSAVDLKLEKLRQDLLSLVPSQEVVDKLSGASNGWWLIRMQSFHDSKETLLSLPVESLARCHPTIIANALLWIAISLQQLPPDFEARSLQLQSPAQFIQQCITLVSTAVSHDETLLSSMEGLECLVLQGIFYNNMGRLRSAWLCYRRAINNAQIMSLHRPVTQWSQSHDASAIKRAKGLWWHIIHADRYLSLTLGLHYGVSDAACFTKQEDLDLSAEDTYMRKLFKIAGSIIDRNQSFLSVDPAMVRSTLTIDSELGLFTTEVPAEWWEDPATIPSGKTVEGATQYARLMVQLWYYQLEALLHLPLMLHAATESRYDYSRQSCLRASRHMITCYIMLRRVTEGSFCCKSLDFQAFTAAITLLINLLSPGSGLSDNEITRREDSAAVDSVIDTLERLTSAEPDQVATQALNALRVLKSIGTGSHNDRNEGQTKLVIPYFGTICLDRGDRRSSIALESDGMNKTTSTKLGSIAPQRMSSQGDDLAQLSIHAHSNSVFPAWDFGREQESEDWVFDGEQISQNLFASDAFLDWGLGL